MWFVDRGRFNLWAMSWAEYTKILAARRGKEGKAAEAAEKKATVEELQVLWELITSPSSCATAGCYERNPARPGRRLNLWRACRRS